MILIKKNLNKTFRLLLLKMFLVEISKFGSFVFSEITDSLIDILNDIIKKISKNTYISTIIWVKFKNIKLNYSKSDIFNISYSFDKYTTCVSLYVNNTFIEKISEKLNNFFQTYNFILDVTEPFLLK